MADKTHPIRIATDSFIKDLNSLASAAPVSVMILAVSRAFSENSFNQFVRTNFKEEDVVKARSINVPRASYGRFNKLHARLDQARNAEKITPRGFVVSLTSQYDVFLSRLINAALQSHPGMLSSSERTYTFSEINTYTSINDIRSALIDAEVDALLRKSIVEQFAWMEEKFSIPLRSDLPVWPEFIELFQRRNLFVHADGVVSKQYLSVCSSQGVDVGHLKVGSQLSVSPEYFKRAHSILLEIGVKLSQVLWRKLDIKSLSLAEDHINIICFDLLAQGKYELARILLDFAFMKSMRRINKETELMLLVNRANAYRLTGDSSKCSELMGLDDWSAYAPKFQLARAVLLEDMNRASQIMVEIGPDSSPSKHDYCEWPLFRVARKDQKFAKAFETTFGEKIQPIVEEDDKATGVAGLRRQLEDVSRESLAAAFGILLAGDMRGWIEEVMGPPGRMQQDRAIAEAERVVKSKKKISRRVAQV